MVCVCNLSYPACNSHKSLYMVICDLSGSTMFFRSKSHMERTGKKFLIIKYMIFTLVNKKL